ncbi:MAG: C10 family peptidase [Prevotella sp.]|nr:C10 family peptidase [Prevotella sp.]
MKKFSTFSHECAQRLMLFVLLAVVALSANANPITRAEARLVAEEFVGINDNSSDDVDIAPYYIFSRGEGKGFVIVSGDDATAPILGYTDQGDFVLSELPEPLQLMLGNWGEKIAKVQAAPKRNAPKRMARERLISARKGVDAFKESWEDVPYMCQTHWSQGSPYNNLCPVNPDNTSQRAVTGCVATAASQIVYYFHKDNPDTLVYATPTYEINWGADYGNYPVTESLPAGTAVEYDQMKMSGSGSARQNRAVAVLMYAVGTCSRLNYGPSTAGQPDEAGKALASQFLLENSYHGKWNYSQQAWETLIYKSLKAGSPMLYGGTHPDQGGHAVVLDGYQAKTGLYHFNFGWGGQGDGYYTVDDETGMNGFKSDQRGCLNFRPKKANLKAKMTLQPFYTQANSEIKVELTNDGTLDFSGLYFYVNTTRNALPSTSTRRNIDQVVHPGETGEFTFVYKPSSTRTCYVFLTDGNKNILDSCTMEVTACEYDMRLEGIKVDAGTQKSELDGMEFSMVNSTNVNVTATMLNGENGTFCQPRMECIVSSYDQETKTWTPVKSVFERETTFETGQTRDVVFNMVGLEEGQYYKAHIDSVVAVGGASKLCHETADTLVYFTVRNGNFMMTIDGRKATATGNWSASLFANVDNDSTVCSYDFTGVSELTETPKAANPNAVFYTSYAVPGANNVVYDGNCDNLVVDMAHEFMPAEAFTAKNATFQLSVDKHGTWGDAMLPFPAPAPYGMQVKLITDIGSLLVESEDVRSIPAMKPILYMADRDNYNEITATNVPVATDTISATEQVVAMTTYGLTDTRSMLFGFKSNIPYFLPAAENTVVEPFRVVVTKYSTSGYRAIPNVQIRYVELADSINHAYEVLAAYAGYATPTALETFKAELQKAEDVFTYLTAEKTTDIRQAATDLGEAIVAFLEAVTTGIETPAVAEPAASGVVEYYSLSGVRLNKPERGIVIMKRGQQVKKILVK